MRWTIGQWARRHLEGNNLLFREAQHIQISARGGELSRQLLVLNVMDIVDYYTCSCYLLHSLYLLSLNVLLNSYNEYSETSCVIA